MGGPWFRALAGCASFDVVFNVLFYGGPPIILVDCAFRPEDSGVPCSCRVMESGDHPPSKFVVFRDNEFVIVSGGVGSVTGETSGYGVEGRFTDEHGVWECRFEGSFNRLREIWATRESVGFV